MMVQRRIRLSGGVGLLFVLLIVVLNMSNDLRAQEKGSLQLPVLEEQRGRSVLDVTRDGRFWMAWELSKRYLAVYERAAGREVMRWPETKGDWHSLFSPAGGIVVTPHYLSEYSLETVPKGIGAKKLSEAARTEMSATPLAAPDSPVVCQTPKGTILGGIIPLPGMAAVGYRQDESSREESLGSRILTRLSLKDCAIQASLPMPYVPELTVNSDYSLLAETGTGGGIWVRDLETFEGKTFIPKDGWWVRGFEGLAFEPNGHTLAVLAQRSYSPDECNILVYDTETGALVRTIETPSDSYGLAFSPDGAILVTAGREKRKRWGRMKARAIVGLYEYHTGTQLAHGVFPWEGTEPIDDGGQMTRGFFTPDRKQLIVSTVWNTRVFGIPENLVRGTNVDSWCTNCAEKEDKAVPASGSPPQTQARPSDPPVASPQEPGPSAAEEELPDGDRCFVYALDLNRGRELMRDGADLEELSKEQASALVAAMQTRFDDFYPDWGEEQLTNKYYSFSYGDGVITASVYYTDESMAGQTRPNKTSVIPSMLLCVAMGEGEFPNACEAPGSAVAETPDTGYTMKTRVKTRLEVNGRPYVVGMECERPKNIQSLAHQAPAAP